LFHNPDAIEIECPHCGATTQANSRTGLLYSHQIPGKVETCPESGKGVIDSSGGDPPLIEPLADPAPPPAPPPIRSGASRSVRAVSGGLPGHGRRH
jgi:hypothetical protein